jgi:hypothetical protein
VPTPPAELVIAELPHAASEARVATITADRVRRVRLDKLFMTANPTEETQSRLLMRSNSVLRRFVVCSG